MEDTAKYLIHADVTANGVVERSDVVGAVFGQTEGLLGTEMDLRKLQETSKVGRIDVDVESERGSSFGKITIASSLDRVETAVLAASLETISRVGPCRATVHISGIEDVRAAKRHDVVDRAKELMVDSFDESVMTTKEILEEVRQSVRVENITRYADLPAGPNVEDSDAIIIVEGRSDVLQLLQFGIKNAIAVEGTNVPEAVGELTRGRTVTAFFDGDRGGDLILKELSQIGDVDYVALAPPGRSVEDLSRREVTDSLREKLPYEIIADGEHEVPAADDQSASAEAGQTTAAEADRRPSADENMVAPSETRPTNAAGVQSTADHSPTAARGETNDPPAETEGHGRPRTDEAETEATGAVDSFARPGAGSELETDGDESEPVTDALDAGTETTDTKPTRTTDTGDGTTAATVVEEPSKSLDTEPREPSTLADHVRAVIEDGSDSIRILDDSFEVLVDAPADEAFEVIDEGADGSWAVVLDGEVTQRLLDVMAQRGIAQVVARELGDFVKRPTSIRIRTAVQLLGESKTA